MTDTDYGVFLRINEFACATGWLHPWMVGWATYGVAVFAMFMVLGFWRAHRGAEPAAAAPLFLASRHLGEVALWRRRC